MSRFFRYSSGVIQYSFDINLNILVRNKNGDIVKSDIMDMFERFYAQAGMTIPARTASSLIVSARRKLSTL